jgi:hypothetical protein
MGPRRSTRRKRTRGHVYCLRVPSPVHYFVQLAASTFLLGFAVANGGCGASGGPAGGASGGSDRGGSVASGGAGSGGQTTGDATLGSGGWFGDAAVPGSTGGQPGSGGQSATGDAPATGGAPGSGGQTGDSGVLDATTSADAPLEPEVAVRLDAPPPFWPQAFVPNCTPLPVAGRSENDGHHHADDDCMTSGCHSNPAAGSGAPAFLFGGTVYKPVATPTPDPGVEVGIRDRDGFYSACSASNGNFWYIAPGDGSAPIWSSAMARLRNANGEAYMMENVAAGCNTSGCHDASFRIVSPF